MITTRLWITAGVNLVAIVVTSYVAVHLLRRRVEGPSRLATRMFALWWGAFALDTLLNTLTWLAAGAGVANEVVTDILSYPALTCIVLMVWGLVYYLAYLFTGRQRLFRPLAAFYALSWVAFLALVLYLRPIGVTLGPYSGAVAYARQPPAAAEAWVALFFLLPPLLAAIAYGFFAFRVKDASHRYRILAVSIGIFVWFTSALVLNGARPTSDVPILVGKALGLACLALILSAYVQPAWLARRLDHRAPPKDPAALAPVFQRATPTPEEKRLALMGRIQELV